jgi:hypothetical protein
MQTLGLPRCLRKTQTGRPFLSGGRIERESDSTESSLIDVYFQQPWEEGQWVQMFSRTHRAHAVRTPSQAVDSPDIAEC